MQFVWVGGYERNIQQHFIQLIMHTRLNYKCLIYNISTANNKCHNFTEFACVGILWKGIVSAQFRANCLNCSKLCRNSAFLQHFHNTKLGDILVVHAVKSAKLLKFSWKSLQKWNNFIEKSAKIFFNFFV